MPPQAPPRKKTSLSPIVILFLLAIAAFGSWLWLQSQIETPHAHNAEKKVISVPPGTGSSAVIAQLNREGILASDWAVLLWLRVTGGGDKIKAGDYRFKSPISAREVIAQLSRGQTFALEFTIPEGYNQFDIARVLSGLQGLKQPPASQDAVLALLQNTTLISDLDAQASSLEGYLFPDTYEYTPTTTRAQLVEAMVKRFRRVFTAEMQQQAEQIGMTTRQVVTLASLIEKEAKVDAERELISQVFHKRMRMRERLACDPTVIYAALLAGKYRGKIYQSDLDRDSQYNTYKYPGLPPGPIASPGRRSLQAALNPAQTDYLFFVVDATRNDGSHKFSASSAEHERAVKILRQSERTQR